METKRIYGLFTTAPSDGSREIEESNGQDTRVTLLRYGENKRKS
jgi:hypothetical protein